MRVLLLASMLACSFEAGTLGDVQMPVDASIDAAVDARLPINLVASANGGTLDSFTSEYCNPSNPPNDCMPGYWLRSNVHDGEHSMGLNAMARAAGWCSTQKLDATPEDFVFSFAAGGNATVERVIVQNWGEQAGYYTTHLIVYGQLPDDTVWNMLLDTALETTETPLVFELASPVVLAKIRFSLTAGQDSAFWEIGELEAWGR